MYPKVKVRSQDTDDQIRNHSLFLNDFQSFSIYDSCFSVKEHQDVPQPLVARIPKNYISNMSNVSRPTTSESEGEEKNSEESDEDNKSNIRATPVPRPRAVLSSPDNDAMIGSKNMIKQERSSVLKNHNQIQNRHLQSQCIVIMHSDNKESPTNAVKTKDTNKRIPTNAVKTKYADKSVLPSAVTQKRNLKSGKSNSIRV